MSDIARILKGVPLFADLPSDAIRVLADNIQVQHLEDNEVLFRRGDPGGALYAILSGTVKVVLQDEHGERLLRELGMGDSLGEMSLLDDSPRTATVISASPVDLLVLHREDFLDVMTALPPDKLGQLRDIAAGMRAKYADLLKGIPMFEGLPDQVLSELVGKLSADSLDQGEVLFHKGDPGDALYLVDKGWVKIVTMDSQGGELILNQCGPGETIGEMSLLDLEPRSASVIALTDGTILLALKREDFDEVLGTYPQVAQHMMRKLASRMRFSTTYIEQAIEFAKHIAEGDYSFVLNQIESSRSSTPQEEISAADRASELLTAFFQMVEGVRQREEDLKQQVRQLTIQIDQAKRKEEFEAVTKSDFFLNLKEQAQKLREERDMEDQ